MINPSATPKARKGVRRTLTSLAAMAAAGLLALGSAAPAAADEPHSGGADAKYTGNVASGYRLKFDKGTVGTTLFELTLKDSSKLPAYCIDFVTPIKSGADYVEDDWSQYPGEGEFANSQPGKTLWILQNAYPKISVEALSDSAEARGLNQKEALSATQAAIWHFSNGVNFEKISGVSDKGAQKRVKKVYDYLVGAAVEVTEAPASLTFTPDEASGVAGEAIGEFTVSTTAESVPLVLDGPDGVKVLDLEGNEIDQVSDGQKFTVAVPEGTEDGEATVTGTTQATVQLGRLFKGKSVVTQTLITAGEGQTEATASAKVTWTKPSEPPASPSPSPSPSETPGDTPSPTPTPSETPPGDTPDEPTKPTPPTTPDDKPGLPVTGAALGGLIAAAVVAVGGGGAAMYLSRKRKSGQGS